MDRESLKELIQKKEGSKLDFKQEINLYDIKKGNKKINFFQKNELIKDILSLANGNTRSSGKIGYLIIGVGDKDKTLYDAEKDFIDNERLISIVNEVCRPEIEDEEIECELIELDKKKIFVISIRETGQVHSIRKSLTTKENKTYLATTIFYRRGSSIRLANNSLAEAIKKAKDKYFGYPQAISLEFTFNNIIKETFSSLINERREGFVGRQYIFDEIEKFIKNEPKGYFLLEGEPGIGKSAIIAQYVHKHKCIAYFNQHSLYNRSHHFLDNICQQIISRYQLSGSSEANNNGNLFWNLLTIISQPDSNNKKIVIAIDALDEVDVKEHSDGSNILYLPDSLPDGVYFILTYRNNTIETRLPCNPHVKKINIKQEYEQENLDDIASYIKDRIKEKKNLNRIINSKRWDKEKFITTLVQKSEGNFMYLRYILDEIERGEYQDNILEKLPDGLFSYYERHWKRMDINSDSEEKLKILRLLIAVRQPISISLISKWSGVKKRIVRNFIQTWKEFLKSSNNNSPDLYNIYHGSFGDFLLKKDEIIDTELTIPGIDSSIEDILKEILSGDEDNLSEDNEYILKYLLSHLSEEVSQKRKLCNLLTNLNFIEAKTRYVGLQDLIEDYNLAFKRSLSIPAKTLEEIRLIQLAFRLSLNALSQDIAQLHGQLLGRLLFSDTSLIKKLLEQATQKNNCNWLKPLSCSLTVPGESLIFTLRGHTKPVFAVVFFNQGQRAISASQDNNLIIWNLVHGTLEKTLEGHNDFVYTLAITPNEQKVVSASEDCTLKVWDLSTGNNLYNLTGHTEAIRAIAITSDGKIVVSASEDTTLKSWSLSDGKFLQNFVGHQDPVKLVAITPDGQRVISASDSTLIIWNLSTASILYTLDEHEYPIQSIALIKTKNSLVSASDDGTLRVWDLNNGQCLKILEGHTNSVRVVAVASDDKQAVSASDDQDLRVWDLDTYKCISVFKSHEKWINALAIINGGKKIITASDDQTIGIWDLEELEDEKNLKYLKEHTGSVYGFAISSDEKRIISTSEDCTLKVWELGAKSIYSTPQHTARINALVVTVNTNLAVSASDDKTVKVWDIVQGRNIHTLEHNSRVSAIAVTPDGEKVISASGNGDLTVWSLVTGTKLQELLPKHDKPVNTITITNDGQWAISVSLDAIMKIWCLDTGTIFTLFSSKEENDIKHSGVVNAIAVTSDKQKVISASDDNNLIVWDTLSGKGLYALQGHTARVWMVKVLANSQQIISASEDNTLKIWDISTGNILHNLQGHSEAVKAVAVTNDGHYAISASFDRTLNVWDLQKNDRLIPPLNAHEDIINDVVLSSDNRYAISASNDRCLKVWNWKEGRLLSTFMGDSEIVSCNVMLYEKKIIAIASEKSGRIHFLQLMGN